MINSLNLHLENEIKITGGLITPLFYYLNMIKRKEITDIVNEIIGDKSLFPDSDIFMVDIKVSANNMVHVFLDTFEGIGIDQCASISVKIENIISRTEDDFELVVSSPGLDKPFKVIQQYQKHVGKDVVVKLTDGSVVSCKLLTVNSESITVQHTENKKKKRDESIMTFNFDQIKETRSIITF